MAQQAPGPPEPASAGLPEPAPATELGPVTPALPTPEAGEVPASPWARPDDTPPIEPPPVALHRRLGHGAAAVAAPGPAEPLRSDPARPVQPGAGYANAAGLAPAAVQPPPGAYPAPSGPPWAPVPPPPRDGRWHVARLEPVPGTPYGTAHAAVPPATSGPAVGSLVTGIAAGGVSLLVACFGLAGARDGWGIWVAGAFSLLGGLSALAAVGLGLTALRQIRRAADPGRIRFTGRGLAVAGLACGGVALGLVVLFLVVVLIVQLG